MIKRQQRPNTRPINRVAPVNQ